MRFALIRYAVKPLPLYYAGYAGASSRWVFDRHFAHSFESAEHAQTWIDEFISKPFRASFIVEER